MSTEQAPTDRLWRFEVRFPLQGCLADRPPSEPDHVREPARDAPVRAELDVAVLGGGPAGARGGCNNRADDGETGPWTICCETAKFVLDDVVLGSGVKVMPHTWVAGVVRDRRRVDAVVVKNKAGRGAIRAKRYIDCTGDADLCRRAGLATQLGNVDGGCQPPSLCFRIAGAKDDAMPMRQVQAELFRTPMDHNGERSPRFLWSSKGGWDQSERMLAGVRVPWINRGSTAPTRGT